MKKPITRYYAWFFILCAASIFIAYVIAHAVVSIGGKAVEMYVIAIISAVIPPIIFFLAYMHEHFDHRKGIFQYIPILVFSIFGCGEKYVNAYQIEEAQKRHMSEEYQAELEENKKSSSQNEKKKDDWDAGYYADQIEHNHKLEGKTFYKALIPLAVVFVVTTVLFVSLFSLISGRMAGYATTAAETKSKLSTVYFIYAFIVEVLCVVSMTSLIYFFMGLYQVKARTCPKCGGYMSYVEIKFLSTKTDVDNQIVTRKKTYDAGSVYIDDEQYSLTAVEYKDYVKSVHKTTEKSLCKCKWCETEKEFTDVSIMRMDEVEK